MMIPSPRRPIVALLVGTLFIPPAVMAQDATAPSPSKPNVPQSAFALEAAGRETAGRPASEPEDESALRRLENVFFISLPFTALHSTLLTTGVALATQKGKFKLTLGYQIAGIGLAILGAGWIAVKDLRKNKEPHLIQ